MEDTEQLPMVITSLKRTTVIVVGGSNIDFHLITLLITLITSFRHSGRNLSWYWSIKDLDDAWLVQRFGHIIALTLFPGTSVTTKGAPTSGCNVLRHFFTRFHFRRTKIERKGAEASPMLVLL